ncbi:MAG: ParB/RepB/Spo0J family partition protein [Vulcanimicrobiaceae bacterium]
MSAPKRGLGRGLEALLGQERSTPLGLLDVPVEAIRPNPQQPRQTFDPEALDELRRSIVELGVLVPIIVRALPKRDGTLQYELIAGERRWRAATAGGLATIPAILRDADDRASMEFAVVENLQRRDLDALEEAMGYQHLIDEYRFTQERLAERLGKSRPAIANALRLLALSDAIKARLRAGTLSVGHARALLSVPVDRREAVASKIEREQLSVRDVERLGAARRETPATTAAPVSKSADIVDVERRLRELLGAPVTIAAGTNGGRIEIRYGDASDLTRVVDLLLRDAT